MDAENEPKPEGLEKLGGALRRLEKDRVFVPGTVDEKVLGAVREHFAAEQVGGGGPLAEPIAPNEVLFPSKPGFSSRQRKARQWQKWLPLAASIAIAAIMFEFARQGRIRPGDVNRDGVVDVVDALALAERVASGGRTSRTWDLNRDGRVDAADSNEIMARVVDLERSGS